MPDEAAQGPRGVLWASVSALEAWRPGGLSSLGSPRQRGGLGGFQGAEGLEENQDLISWGSLRLPRYAEMAHVYIILLLFK
jgi:hypothetical protein